VGIQSKLEYQPFKGWEEVTLKENARWWIYTYIRPDAHLILGRINVFDSKLMNYEYKDMTALLPPVCSFRPERSSKLLFVILHHLKGFSAGKYIMSHKPGNNFIIFYHSIKNPQTESENIPVQHNGSTDTLTSENKEKDEIIYDLYASHQDSGGDDRGTVPFIPTRWVPQNNQIPYTFPIKTTTPVAQPLIPNKIKYCYAFANTGKCPKTECPFPHLSMEDVVKKSKKSKSKKRKWKAGNNKNKKAKLKAQNKESEENVEDDSSTNSRKHKDLDTDDPMDRDDNNDVFDNQLAIHMQKQGQEQSDDIKYINEMLHGENGTKIL